MLKQILKLNFQVFRNINAITVCEHLPKYQKQYFSTSINIQNNTVPPDSQREKKLKILYLEVDVARQEGRRVPNPELIKPDQWDHLLSLQSRSARSKYYLFLWHIEKKHENLEKKKIQKAEALVERKAKEKLEAEENNHIIYGIAHTGFLLRIYDTTINHWHNNKLIRAMQFGQKIVLDCSYDEYMNKRESVNTAKQLMLCFAENRAHDDPFDMHFCNTNFNGTTMQYLEKHIPTMRDASFPMHIHAQCFTDIFPKEKLVYLTPHCRTELLEYNPDNIYIIGGIVDKINNEPLSLGKAKRLGLRMARLPLDHYLTWSPGSGKSLTLNQMVNILLDIKDTGDWNYSLRHVPKRKIFNPLLEDEYKQKNENKLKTRSAKFDFDIENWASRKSFKTNYNKVTNFKSRTDNNTNFGAESLNTTINSNGNPFRK